MSGGKSWTAAEHRRLRRLYPDHDTATIVITGRSRAAIRSRAKVLGLRKTKQRKHWTPAEDRQLRKLYGNHRTKKLAAKFKTSIWIVYQHANSLGLKKTAAYRAKTLRECGLQVQKHGIAHQFKKGLVPANKGLRRPGYAPGRMAETQFKKGQVSLNTMPLWSFRWCDGYLMLKTGADTPMPTKGWEYVHKLIWEQAHGPLPDWREARIWWKDGDHANNSLANLELLDGHEHILRTQIHKLPEPLKKVIRLRSKLNRKIREMDHGKKHVEGLAGSPVRNAGRSEGASRQAG